MTEEDHYKLIHNDNFQATLLNKNKQENTYTQKRI